MTLGECVAAKAREWMRAFSALIVQNLLYLALVVICAFIYNRRRATFGVRKRPQRPLKTFITVSLVAAVTEEPDG